MASFVKVATTAELRSGEGKVVDVGGRAIALFHCDGQWYATDNTCPHRGGPLGEGSVSGMTVTCPWHGWEFDVSTGQCTLTDAKINAYPVKIDGEDVLVSL
ncbi:MAG TPA: Rieske 2Fe-2S domain-containing protein [bacterium]